MQTKQNQILGMGCFKLSWNSWEDFVRLIRNCGVSYHWKGYAAALQYTRVVGWRGGGRMEEGGTQVSVTYPDAVTFNPMIRLSY